MSKTKKKKEFYKIKVIDAGAKGKSIAKAPDGKIIFIEKAVPGDVVDLKTLKKRKNYYEARVTKKHRLSPFRNKPMCVHFDYCGGCKWQHMDYKKQLFYKQKEVLNNLQRIGKIDVPKPLPIIKSKKKFFYRNKMEFTFSNNRWLFENEIKSKKIIDDRNALGFHIPDRWDKILDIEECLLQEDPSNKIRNSLKTFAVEKNIPFFDIKEQKGILRNLIIRISSTGELMVIVQFFKDSKEEINAVLKFLKNSFPKITSLQYIINPKKNDTIYDQDIIVYSGKDHIIERMGKLFFKINAKSFYQTNSEQAHKLYQKTLEFANLKGNEIVYDLYSGTGTIAQFIAKNAKLVIGVEIIFESVELAKENAVKNRLTNVKFFHAKIKNILNQEFVRTHGQPNLIITDPPRNGMHQDVVNQILKINPEKIIYISCNSATQARDLNLLDKKYLVTKTQSIDMFPQTHHVENIVLLNKRN